MEQLCCLFLLIAGVDIQVDSNLTVLGVLEIWQSFGESSSVHSDELLYLTVLPLVGRVPSASGSRLVLAKHPCPLNAIHV